MYLLCSQKWALIKKSRECTISLETLLHFIYHIIARMAIDILSLRDPIFYKKIQWKLQRLLDKCKVRYLPEASDIFFSKLAMLLIKNAIKKESCAWWENSDGGR